MSWMSNYFFLKKNGVWVWSGRISQSEQIGGYCVLFFSGKLKVNELILYERKICYEPWNCFFSCFNKFILCHLEKVLFGSHVFWGFCFFLSAVPWTVTGKKKWFAVIFPVWYQVVIYIFAAWLLPSPLHRAGGQDSASWQPCMSSVPGGPISLQIAVMSLVTLLHVWRLELVSLLQCHAENLAEFLAAQVVVCLATFRPDGEGSWRSQGEGTLKWS